MFSPNIISDLPNKDFFIAYTNNFVCVCVCGGGVKMVCNKWRSFTVGEWSRILSF